MVMSDLGFNILMFVWTNFKQENILCIVVITTRLEIVLSQTIQQMQIQSCTLVLVEIGIWKGIKLFKF